MVPVLAALLVAAAAAVSAALLLVLPGHRGVDGLIALVSLAVGTAAGAAAFFHARRLPGNRPALRRRLSPWAWAVFGAFGWFAFHSFCWLVYPSGGNLLIGSPNNLGDVSLHMMLADGFAHGAAWWPDNPEAAGHALRYYPGVDLFQGLLQAAGADELPTLTWVSLLGAAAAAAALYRWGGSFAVAGFLFSGGLAGFRFFQKFELADYQAALAWKSLPLAVFVTQRPFLYALPAGLLLMIHWRGMLDGEGPTGKGPKPKLQGPRKAQGPGSKVQTEPEKTAVNLGVLPFWVEALLYATLPLFHLFAFVFTSALLGWWLAAYWFERPALRRHLLWLIAVALVPATAAVALMTGNFSPGETRSLWLQPGWMAHGLGWGASGGFWLLNFGGFALLAPALWLRCLRAEWRAADGLPPPREEQTAGAFVLPAGALFLLACVVMFAPWEWDNTKLMLWCYVAVLPFVWARWVRPLVAPLRWGACALLFFSGAECLVGAALHHPAGYELVPRADLDGVRAALDYLPIGARFAAAPEYNHPLVYCGRKLAMGYAGHLASEGVDYQRLEAQLKTLMNGEGDWRGAARRLGVRYLFWGPRELARYPKSARPWEAACAVVAAGGWGTIYDLDAPATPVPAPAPAPR